MRRNWNYLLLIGLVSFACIAYADSFVSTDVPMPIPDGPSGIAESHLFIGVNRAVLDINVVLSITHPFVGDLRIYLEAPNNGEVVRLANRCGLSGNNYTNTIFDDEATVEICAGDPPFTGSFAPDMPLYELDGLGTYGTWILRITDNAANDVGTLTAWRLDIVLGDSLAAEPAPPAIPTALEFFGNFPNPFNAQTEFRFAAAREMSVELVLFDVTGRVVGVLFNGRIAAGEHTVSFDATDFAGGVYLARLQGGEALLVRKVVLVK